MSQPRRTVVTGREAGELSTKSAATLADFEEMAVRIPKEGAHFAAPVVRIGEELRSA